MRCPNCGMDIVIATHLCPHCGYAHEFDGRIETRRDIPEPWEITPGKAKKRRERRERAAEAWASSRAGKREKPENASAVREPRREAQQAGAGSFARAMHSFSLLSIGVMMVLLFGSALLLYSGSYYMLTSGVSADYVYSQLPSLRSADQLLCVCYGFAGLFALSSLLKLRKRESGGTRGFYIAAGIYAAASLLYGVFVLLDFKTADQLVEAAMRLIPFAVYVGVLTVHFRRNAGMYAA